jgi:hypothetical protein
MPATALRGVATTVDGSTSLIINGGAAGATTTIGATGTTGEIKVGIATTGETSTVSIGNGIPATGVTHTVNIGSASISSTGQDIINIGTGTIDTVAGAKTVNIATGNATTGTKAVNVATGSGVVTVAVGSSSSKIGIGTSAPGSAGVAISGPATTIDGTTSLIINGGTADATTTIGAAGTTGEIKVGIATTVNGTVSITNATTTGTNTVNIGGAASTTGTDLINIGTGAPTDVGNKTISIATGDNAHGGTTTVSIGTGSMTSGSGNSAITIGSATMPTVNIVTSSSGASTYKQADGTYAAPSYTFSNSTGGISTGNYYYSDTTRIANTAFAINESETFDVNQGPALTFMANGTFAVAYTTATTPGTYLRRYNANYSAIAAAAQVDTDNVAGATSGAAIAYDASHDYIIVAWVKADGGVYVRPYTSAGVAVNAAVLVSSGHAAATTGEFPSLAIEGDGTIGVFWRATADGILYGNTVSTSWAAGTAVAVSGTGTVAAGGGQCAAYLGGTKAVVCWKRSNADGDQNKLYYNTYDITTGTAGTPALVQDTALDASDKHGAVAALRFGNVMFAYKTGANSLHRQVRDNTLATTITADAELVAATGNQCALAADGLSFMVAYATGGIVGKELMVANYDSVGTAIGTGIRVTSASEDTINIASRPAMALCGGDCVASWYQYHATVPEAVKAQAFSLKGMGASTIGGRSMRTSTIGGTNALKNTTDVYGTLNVTGGDIATSGNLYVNGSVNMAALTMSGSLNVNGDICATGAINGNRTSCPSDKRIKTNIETLDQHACLKTINQLRPVSYTFTPEFIRKANAQASKQVGLIAQEVEPFAPEIVLHGTFAGEDLKTISYERLVPYLISSIQELNKKIEQLEAKK